MSRDVPNSIKLVVPEGAQVDQGEEVSAVDNSRAPNLVSIVVPCIGQLEYTQLCVPSLLRHTRSPFELVFVDVGTLDGTSEYLAGIKAATLSSLIEIVPSPADAGLPAACDAGIVRSRGRYIVILSNETIVPAGWLNQLVALAAHDPTIGVVGAMSNHASSGQSVGAYPHRPSVIASLVADVRTYPPDHPVDLFADQWRQQNRGQWFEAETLDLFCLLYKREVLERIGPFARIAGPAARHRFQLQYTDEQLLARRVREAGFHLACCRDLFIHCFGSRTAIRSPLSPP